MRSGFLPDRTVHLHPLDRCNLACSHCYSASSPLKQSILPLEPILKRTQWFVRRPLTGAQLVSPDLPEVIAGFAQETLPLLRFGWEALDA